MFNIITMKNVQSIQCLTQKIQRSEEFEEKLTSGLENNMKNMANFHQNNLKSQNWDNDGIL